MIPLLDPTAPIAATLTTIDDLPGLATGPCDVLGPRCGGTGPFVLTSRRGERLMRACAECTDLVLDVRGVGVVLDEETPF